MSKSNLRNPLIASLASFDDGEASVLDHTEQVAIHYDHEQTLDGQIRDLDDVEQRIEYATIDSATLESLCDALEDCRSVGLESRSAQLVRAELSSIQKRYGIEQQETPFPAMECFRGDQTRMYTSVSLESVKETLHRVWMWIKEQIEHLIALMKRFYHHLMRSLDSLAEESRVLKNQARQTKLKGGVTISLGYAARKICLNGKVEKDFVSVMNTVSRLNRVSDDTLERISNEFLEKVKTKLDADNFDVDMTTEVLIPSGFQPDREIGRFAFGADAYRVFVSPHLPGDRVVVVGVFGHGNAPAVTDFRNGFTRMYGRTMVVKLETPDPESDVPSLSSEEVFTLCQRIDKTIASLKTSRSDIERHLSNTKRMVDDMIRKYSSDQGEGTFVRILRERVGDAWKNTLYGTKLVRLGEEVAYDVCRGYLTWARKSLDVVVPATVKALPAA